MLRGEFDTGSPPDKRPKFNPETRVKKGKTPPALGGAKERLYLGSTFWKCAFYQDMLGINIRKSPNQKNAV